MTDAAHGGRLIALWSAPRSRSTAFLRMMTQRGDVLVVHEPFSHVIDFGVAEVAGVEVTSEAALMARLLELAAERDVFFKDTTDFRYPDLLAGREFLARVTHTFIIREPAAAIASHAALNPRLTCAEVGIERLAEIHDHAVAAGAEPIVLDADDLVTAPAALVAAYCAAVGLDPRPDALEWAAGTLPAWERTARWHAATSETTGFVATATSYARTTDTDPVLAGFLAHHRPFYDRLHATRLRA
ncbi:hypothetical protein SAMN05443575_0307 [Jatrophihabitans endophyticus]|uniref:Sulfotransferase family protein n=1 Tax=Jatrophihabitans endophyticus TaxID=1206085 RepID=A0A1M5CPB5_9ACTN|nr:sulfotransferase family protein [Jatrophihabitans endophyticus]SHF56551.1 hypothetical protein SAMN05443575_0307 [Jatrophihabitans endophyticus]